MGWGSETRNSKRGSRAERKAGQKAGQTSRLPFSRLMDGCIQMNEGDRPNKEHREGDNASGFLGGGGGRCIMD